MSNKEKLNIMMYGIDRFGYHMPGKPLEHENYIMHFRYFLTEDKFQDYDGVIVFHRTFEDYSESWNLVYHEKELLKRENQLRQLIEKGGFCCFLLGARFVDYYDDPYHSDSRKDTDLTKRVLNLPSFYRTSLDKPVTDLRIVRDEFRSFLKDFGSAQTRFESHDKELNLKPICFAGIYLTGFVMNNSFFFVPCLLPDKREKEFSEFFSLLANALVSSFTRLSHELHEWTEEYRFQEESKLLNERDSLNRRIYEIDQRLSIFNEYKKCLCYDDELLKESVISILENGFNFDVDQVDEFREDLKILDKEKKPMILVEVKGTNRGVQREFINQADSHRERSKFSADFPSIVIINTNIKNARTLQDKYQEIAKEQVAHAVKMKILVLRTIDF